MKPDAVHDVLFDEAQIAGRVRVLAQEIAAVSQGPEPLTLVGVLRGSFIFLADLVRALHRQGVRARVDFMVLESYGSGSSSSGNVRLNKDISLDVRGQDVLLVDDILDSGRTLSFACRHLKELGARTVKACVLLDKPSRRAVPAHADFIGFTVPDEFIVGYGLDYNHAYRELPWIGRVPVEGP
ncbi:MAG: hypoxanthine phosphoribosyltransferase [Kiritimatiellae bacterium]|nr:hypoxanthine phosphoribosyltransferase [Kiritimatiellia bacterium]